MYLAKAIAQEGNPAGHPAGEKHSMLVFLSGYTDSYDWREAERVANAGGWDKVNFTKAGKITRQDLVDQDRNVNACFDEALRNGCSLLVYGPAET